MKIKTFYRYPDLDARIAVHVDGDRVSVSFLAQGNAYKGGELYKRNPDRREAVDRLLPCLDVVMARAGKTAIRPFKTVTKAQTRRAYSQGRTYRFDVLHVGAFDPEALGLVPCENRPVAPVNW